MIVEAIDRLVADLERERIDREIVEGYTRVPDTDEELAWAEWSALRVHPLRSRGEARRSLVGRAPAMRAGAPISCSPATRRSVI